MPRAKPRTPERSLVDSSIFDERCELGFETKRMLSELRGRFKELEAASPSDGGADGSAALTAAMRRRRVARARPTVGPEICGPPSPAFSAFVTGTSHLTVSYPRALNKYWEHPPAPAPVWIE